MAFFQKINATRSLGAWACILAVIASETTWAQEEEVRLPSGRILRLPSAGQPSNASVFVSSLPSDLAKPRQVPANAAEMTRNSVEKMSQQQVESTANTTLSPPARFVPVTNPTVKPVTPPPPAVKAARPAGWQVMNRVDPKTQKTLEVAVYWQHGERIPFDAKLINTCLATIDNSIVEVERRNSLNLLARIDNWQLVPAAATTLRSVCLNDFDPQLRWASVRMLSTIPPQNKVVQETLVKCAQFDSEAIIRDFCNSQLQQNPLMRQTNPKR